MDNIPDTNDVVGVQFSIIGPEEIRNRSVVEVTKHDTYDKDITELTFESDWDCHEYIFDQKVILADDLLAEYRVVDGENLTGFDFLCETRFIQTEEV